MIKIITISCFQMALTICVRFNTHITPHNFCCNNSAKKPFLGTAFVNALLLVVRVAGPHPDGHGYQERTENYCFHHPLKLLLQQHCQKVIPWDSPW